MDPPPTPTPSQQPPPSSTSTPTPSTTTHPSPTTPSNNTLPRLAVLPPSKTHPFHAPQKRIHTGADLPHFLTSLAYRDIGLFLLQLNRALCPRSIPPSSQSKTKIQSFPLPHTPRPSDPPSIASLREMLDKIASLIDQAPPEKGPRRFGNVAFRVFHKLLEERVDGLLREGLPAERLDEQWGEGWLEEVRGYLLGGFGSAQRLDYGTGHELSFLAFLGGLWKLGVFGNGEGEGEVERGVVLGVFEP